MNCLAAQTSQSLGYHRLVLFPVHSGDPAAEQDERLRLMTFAYILDKGLALRLGRASVFQDYDILMPSYSISHDPWQMISILWFRHAEIQGKLYERLYSSRARALLPEQRIQYALGLAEEVRATIRDTETVRQQLGETNVGVNDPGFVAWDIGGVRFAYLSDMVTYHGTLSLIYRAVAVDQNAPGPFVPECVEAGRVAFSYHAECMRITKPYPGLQACYIHW
jgi:hypothetical protein